MPRGLNLQLALDVFNVFDKQTGYNYETRIGTLGFTNSDSDPSPATVAIPNSISDATLEAAAIAECAVRSRGLRRQSPSAELVLRAAPLSAHGARAVLIPIHAADSRKAPAATPAFVHLEEPLARDELARRRVGVRARRGDARRCVGLVQQHAHLRALEERHRIVADRWTGRGRARRARPRNGRDAR